MIVFFVEFVDNGHGALELDKKGQQRRGVVLIQKARAGNGWVSTRRQLVAKNTHDICQCRANTEGIDKNTPATFASY